MRYAALFCICVSVAGAGAAAAARSRRRVSALGGLAAFFDALALSAALNGSDPDAVLACCAGADAAGLRFPADLRAALAAGMDIAAAWQSTAAQSEEARALRPAEAALLQSFGAAFSEPSLKVFRESCIRYRDRFAALHREAYEKNSRNGRLYVTFSSLLAALLFIILV